MPNYPKALALVIGIALFGSAPAASEAHHFGERLPFTVATKRIAAIGIPNGPDEQGRPRLPELVWEAGSALTVFHAPVCSAFWRFVYLIEGEWVQHAEVLGADGLPLKSPNPTAGIVAFQDYVMFVPEAQPSFPALYQATFGQPLLARRTTVLEGISDADLEPQA